MKPVHYERTVLGHPISATLSDIGEDLLVQVTGGCAPHVGSVSIGYPADGGISTEKLLLPTHRDDVVGDLFARTLAQRLSRKVTVICGIHYDAPGKDGLAQIVACAQALLDDIVYDL